MGAWVAGVAGVEGWKGGRVEEWKSGRVEEWKSGSVEAWKRGSVEAWKGDRVGRVVVRKWIRRKR